MALSLTASTYKHSRNVFSKSQVKSHKSGLIATLESITAPQAGYETGVNTETSTAQKRLTLSLPSSLDVQCFSN